MEHKTRLKPIVYTTSYFKRGYQNTTQQMMLLKALQITQDPKKLKAMIGVKSVAQVYETLDKLALRKEYHQALTKSGISFDFIVDGIKNIAEKGYKDGDRLKAFQTLLKSVGMDKYDHVDGDSSGTWEEVLLQKIEEEKNTEQPLLSAPPSSYEVKFPVVPESVKDSEEEEREMTSSIYENN